MSSDKKIVMIEFMSVMEKYLKDFEEDYLKNSQLEGEENWPRSLTESEWLDQFIAYLETL